MGQIKFMTSIIMVALFSIAIITFAINFGIDNESAVKLGDDTEFVTIKNDMLGEVTSFKTDANSSSNALTSSTIEPGDETVATGGQFKVGVGTSMKMVTKALTGGFNKIFGKDTGFGIFLSALTAIMLWALGLYVWKTWRGNPD